MDNTLDNAMAEAMTGLPDLSGGTGMDALDEPHPTNATRSGTPVRVPKSERQMAINTAKIKADAENVTVPTDLKAAFGLWRDTYNLPRRSRSQAYFRQCRMKFIGPKIFALQNPAPAPNITANDHAPASAQYLLSRAEQRGLCSAALLAAVEVPEEDLQPLSPKDLDPVRQLLVSGEDISPLRGGGKVENFFARLPSYHNDPAQQRPAIDMAAEETNLIPGLLRVANRALQTYEICVLEHWHELNPDSYKAEVAAKVTPEKSKQELDDLKDELIRFNNPNLRRTFQANAFAAVHAAWQPARSALSELFTHAKTLLLTLKQGAVDSEKSFFENAGLPVEKTSVSRRFDKLIAEVEHHILRVNSMLNSGGATYPIAADQLSWFGIKDII